VAGDMIARPRAMIAPFHEYPAKVQEITLFRVDSHFDTQVFSCVLRADKSNES
jgi:hypothetical protein